MRNTWSFLAGAAALTAVSSFSPLAHAGGLAACGDIFIDAGAACEVLVEGGCTAKCEPPAFTAACAVENTLQCGAECSVDADDACLPGYDPDGVDECLDQHSLCLLCAEDDEQFVTCQGMFDDCVHG